MISLPRPVAVRRPKAEVGTFVSNMTYNPKLFSLERTPQRQAEQAQALYRSNYWVRKAETTVSGRVAGLPWHLEDVQDNEITDEDAGPAGVVRDLLDYPQANLDPELRQPGIATYRDLIKLTSRHMGLVGTAFWFLDSVLTLGYPNAILVINPAMMFEVTSKAGQVIGWTYGKKLEQGGTPLRLEEVRAFYLDPPDSGAWGIGLAEAIYGTAQLVGLSDRHQALNLQGGARLSGIVSPKEGAVISDDAWAQFVRDWRSIQEDSDSAKRLQIAKGPIDYVRTAATMAELQVIDIANASRDNILATWGVPLSQTGVSIKAGLNSGETKGFDEAVLMQGAVHDRVAVMSPVVQTVIDLFDVGLEYEVEEPSFDDELPQYEIASTATSQPLTRNERRQIMGQDPLPDWDPDTGDPLGIAIDLPATIVTIGNGPSDQPRPVVAPPPTPPVVTVAAPVPPQLQPGTPAMGMEPAKAGRSFLALRSTVDRRYVPAARRSVAAVLDEQKRMVAAAIRKMSHLTPKVPGWRQDVEEQRMYRALRPHVAALTETVTQRMSELVPKQQAAKADAWEMRVQQTTLDRVANRVKDITDTTRSAIQAIIEQAIADDLSPDEAASLIEDAATFDSYRSEMIALTEMGKTYNEAALGSYGEFGVSSVEAVDGDQDEACAARDGQTFTLDEADAETADEHPNGTLDFIPLFDEGKAVVRVDPMAELLFDILAQEAKAGPSEPRPLRYEMTYDAEGRLLNVTERPL